MRMPPTDFHALQAVPSNERVHSALSVPRAKRSIRLTPQETAAGSEVTIPPSESHADHALPSKDRCHMALSLPRAKTSVRLAPQDEAATPEGRIPPSGFHGVVVANFVASSCQSSGAPPP